MAIKITTWVVGPLETNCFLLVSGGEGILVDPGWELPDLTEALAGVKLKEIIATHVHLDHVLGANEARAASGARFLVPEGDEQHLDRLGPQAEHIGFPPPPDIKADGLLKGGEEITFGREGARVLDTPGHTPGHISLLTSSGVFVGDTLFAGAVGRTDFPGSSAFVLLRSIRERLLSLPDDTVVYPGHGPATTVGEERKNNPFLKDA